MFFTGDVQRSISSIALGSKSQIAGQPPMLVAVAQQLLGAAGQRVTGGLVAADQQQQRLGDDLVILELGALDLRVHQDADQVVGGLLLALGRSCPSCTRSRPRRHPS